jgi:integral membrane protein
MIYKHGIMQKMANNNKILNRFLKVGLAEGLSFIILLAIAMPLKYFAGIPAAVRIVGMLHGLLFIAFCITLLHAAKVYRWKIITVIVAFLLSFIPFGTFYLEKVIKNQHSKRE